MEHAFQAEVSQVLDLVIHSLYRNKEIFLRELISNASDAIDKRRFEAIGNPALADGDAPEITIVPDADAKTLTITDNGIGMSEEELIKNLGTVAHSGTKAFAKALESGAGGVELIGQFGVGFYAAFLVADKVEVISRAAGSEDAFKWTSDARSSFTVEPWGRLKAGTSIVLHLKDDEKEFLGTYKLRNLVKRYSDYVGHPILLALEAKPAVEEEDGVIDADAQKPGERDYEVINQDGALWQRSPDDITDEQYEEFYKHLTHDWEAPIARTHFSIEGTHEFTSLLYIPGRAPFDLFDRDSKHGVKLFVRRVFIMDDAEELLPVWLRFVRGVVDASDLPLNVSRDVLQDSRAAKVIRKQVVKKTLDLLESIAADKPEDYAKIWDTYGKVLKEGLHFDPDFKQRLSKLIRYESSAATGLTSFEAYVERMPEGQNAIYYSLGASRQLVESSPHLEGFRKKGYEVLYMTDPIDQWAVDGLSEFGETPLVSVANADLDLNEGEDADSKKAAEDRAEAMIPLTEKFQKVLGDRVREVKLSRRLEDSPVCLVVPEGGLPSHIERMLRAQNQAMPKTPRILEINPTHPIIVHLEGNVGSKDADEYIELLYGQALLVEGSPIDNPSAFATSMSKMMTAAFGTSSASKKAAPKKAAPKKAAPKKVSAKEAAASKAEPVEKKTEKAPADVTE